MIVVSDTGPLNYLALIGHLEALPRLFGQVFIPPAVAAELTHADTPQPARDLVEHPPAWLTVQVPSHPLADVSDLGRGEEEAIALSLDLEASFLLCDDADARAAAERLGVKVIGTLGILYEAAGRNLISFPDAIERLRRTTFRAAPALIERLLQLDRARTKPPVADSHDTPGATPA